MMRVEMAEGNLFNFSVLFYNCNTLLQIKLLADMLTQLEALLSSLATEGQ